VSFIVFIFIRVLVPVVFNILRHNELDHSKLQCFPRMGFCQEHIKVLLVLIMKHTQAMRSVDFCRILVFLIFLYGAMFDFTDMTEMDFLACSEIVGKA